TGAVAAVDVELDIDVAGGGRHGVNGGGGQRCASDVGVQDDAGGVEDRAQVRGVPREGGDRGVGDRLRWKFALAHALLRRVHGCLDRGCTEQLGCGDESGVGEHRV